MFAGMYMFKKNVTEEKFSYPPPPPHRKMMVRPLYPQSFFKLQSQSYKTMSSRPGEERRESLSSPFSSFQDFGR